MELRDYQRAVMLCNEPSELLTHDEARQRVKLLSDALRFKAWRMQVASHRLQNMEDGQTVRLDLFEGELDELWPHAEDPIDVHTTHDGLLSVTRCTGGASSLLIKLLVCTGALLAAALAFG